MVNGDWLELRNRPAAGGFRCLRARMCAALGGRTVVPAQGGESILVVLLGGGVVAGSQGVLDLRKSLLERGQKLCDRIGARFASDDFDGTAAGLVVTANSVISQQVVGVLQGGGDEREGIGRGVRTGSRRLRLASTASERGVAGGISTGRRRRLARWRCRYGVVEELGRGGVCGVEGTHSTSAVRLRRTPSSARQQRRCWLRTGGIEAQVDGVRSRMSDGLRRRTYVVATACDALVANELSTGDVEMSFTRLLMAGVDGGCVVSVQNGRGGDSRASARARAPEIALSSTNGESAQFVID